MSCTEGCPPHLDAADSSGTDVSGGYIFELANAAAEQWWAGQLGETQPAAAARLGPTRVDFKYPKVRSRSQPAVSLHNR